MAGQFMWFDLGATDAGQAREFYRALFGWAVAPAADAGPYQAWITDGEQPWAGIVHADTEGGGWLPYVMVRGPGRGGQARGIAGRHRDRRGGGRPGGHVGDDRRPGRSAARVVQAARRPGLMPGVRGGRIGPRTSSGQARRKGRSCGL